MDREPVEYWNDFHHFFVVEGRVQLGAMVDPELLKCTLNDMVEEAGVKLFLHSWGTKAVTEGNEVKGVIFESKSGRQFWQRSSLTARETEICCPQLGLNS